MLPSEASWIPSALGVSYVRQPILTRSVLRADTKCFLRARHCSEHDCLILTMILQEGAILSILQMEKQARGRVRGEVTCSRLPRLEPGLLGPCLGLSPKVLILLCCFLSASLLPFPRPGAWPRPRPCPSPCPCPCPCPWLGDGTCPSWGSPSGCCSGSSEPAACQTTEWGVFELGDL